MHVALVALGPSSLDYVVAAESRGGLHAIADEVWTCNTYANVLRSDIIFHMDDVRVQEQRKGNVKIQNLLKYFKTAKKPPYGPKIYTSRPHPDYPALQAFPLEKVLNACGSPYFNNTGAYMIAYAIYKKVKRISLFGFDFTYADRNSAETGRGCCEYWLGRAHERGIETIPCFSSTLLDANTGCKMYGYDTWVPQIAIKDNKATITFTEVEPPTEVEIEKRYANNGDGRPLL